MSLWHHTKRVTLHVTKKTGHLLFPYLWHYFTDEYKDRRHHLIVDTILSLFIVGLLGGNIVLGAWFYLYSIEPNVNITVLIPDVVISGESFETEIVITPTTKSIADVEATLIVPTGYAISGDTTWQWDELAKATHASKRVVGTFDGNVGEQYRLALLVNYRYFGRQLFDYAVADFRADTSSLEVIATAPERILNNESFTWTVDYRNSSTVPRNNVCIQLELPSSFAVEGASLPLTDTVFQLISLQPLESGTISITGSFRNAIGEGSHVIGVAAIDRCTNERYRQVALSTLVQVLTPRLELLTSGPSVLNVGDVGLYTIWYTNTGDAQLAEVRITTPLTNATTRFRSISASKGGTLSDSTIQWVDIGLAPGETRSQTFFVASSALMRERNAQLSYDVAAEADIADIDVTTYAPTVNGPTTKFNSTLQFDHVARYTSTTGEQLGYGPYPLEAWNVTALRVFWQVSDFTNDLENVTVTTTLPSQVEWTGHTAVSEGTAMTYDETTRTVTWHASRIPAFSHNQGANFEVRVLPNSEQVGKVINITNDTSLTARDSFTGIVLTKTQGALRTDQPILPEE